MIYIVLKKEKQINEQALNYYFNLGRNDNNETIFKHIFKLMPGELLILDNNIVKKEKFFLIWDQGMIGEGY